MVTQSNNPAVPQKVPVYGTGATLTASACTVTNPLHYGGVVSQKTGRLGQRAGKGHQFKAKRRLENIARLENAGFTKPQIAAMVSISVNRLSYIMKSADYLITRMAITHGIVLDGEAQLSQIKAQRKEMLTQLLPPALQALANELQAPAVTVAERKLKASIVQDFFDREGTFAKISRTEIKPVEQFDFEKADQASNSLINTIRGVALPEQSQATLAALAANKEFSNSHTLNSIDQQLALKELEAEADSLRTEAAL